MQTPRVVLSLPMSIELHQRFKAALKENQAVGAQILRELVRVYVEAHEAQKLETEKSAS